MLIALEMLAFDPCNKVGLSLSFCIRDIALGTVREDEVVKIVTSTCAGTDEEWEQLLDDYSRTYWSWADCVDEARAVANRLRDRGLIVQPRLTGHQPPNISNGCWMSITKYMAQTLPV